MENTGDKIKRLRKEKGLTLQEVGDAVGVGKSTVRKWEEGMIANMKRDKIAKLAETLGVTPGYLLGWKEPEITLVVNNNEIELKKTYEQLSEEQRERVLAYAIKLLEIKKIEEGSDQP